jgi:hypothetical protein
MKLKCLEIWSGDATGLAAATNANITTLDIDPKFNPSICKDILDVSLTEIRSFMNLDPGERPFFIWASPDCSVYSVAAFGHGHYKDGKPNTDKADYMQQRHIYTKYLIEELNPVYFVIENPLGLLRKMDWMKDMARETVTYCQYGSSRRKPTDLWGRFPESWQPRPMCKNGDPCHEPAPAGSNAGTQSISKRLSGHIPYELSAELWNAAIKDEGAARKTLEEWI